MHQQHTFFAPMLILKDGHAAIIYYQKAFNAKLLRKWDNEDGSLHVAELQADGAIFFLRQEGQENFSPEQVNGVTTIHHIFTANPDEVFNQAIEAGATLVSPMEDYDYGYRQGVLVDPFGHQWIITARL